MAAFAGARSLPVIAAISLLLSGCSSSMPTPSLEESGAASSSYRLGRPHYTVKPYQVNGVWYYPRVDYAYEATGTASWYGPGFDRRPTADGEIYDMNGLSAAHKTLPLPSIVEITNLRNGRELTLRVNDRGPFVGDRLIDVSRRAAQLLGFARTGTAPVRVRVVKDASIRVAEAAMHGAFGETAYAEAAPAAVTEVAAAPPPAPEPVRLASAVPPSLRATEVVEAVPPPPEPAPVLAPAAPPPPSPPSAMLADAAPPPMEAPASRPPPAEAQTRRVAAASPRRHFWPSLIPQAHAETLPHRIVLSSRHAAGTARPIPDSVRVAEERSLAAAMPRHSGGIFVQAGAFAVAANAERVRARIAVFGRTEVVRARVRGAALYRVRVGPITGQAEARRLLGRVIARGYPEARLVAR